MRSLEEAHELVRRYYDNNTKVFEKYGQGATAIHRSVWGPGVRSRTEAFRYLDRLVLEEIQQLGAANGRVLDLGCGVGGSLLALAAALPELTGVGVTLSSVQAQRARQLIATQKIERRMTCVEADFVALPDDLATFDLAFAFESFAHCADAAAFFRSSARHVRPGGRLVIFDDFLARDPNTSTERRWVERVRECWLCLGLASVVDTAQQAAAHGFKLITNTDLTAYLELRRPRDRAIAMLLLLGSPLPLRGTLWKSWQGGDALQRALMKRLIEFRWLRFERVTVA